MTSRHLRWSPNRRRDAPVRRKKPASSRQRYHRFLPSEDAETQTIIASAVNGKNVGDPRLHGRRLGPNGDRELGSCRCAPGCHLRRAEGACIPPGNPEHAQLTVASNPFAGITAGVTVPRPPEFTVSEPGEAPRVNSGSDESGHDGYRAHCRPLR